jgi:uncharacterized protein YdhG (YjbR/CyaY superfamily)
MQINADNPEAYIDRLPPERRDALALLRRTILENLPEGFAETMSYGMIGYVVPHSIYPGGYHADPSKPLPFINIASQKNFIAFYHMGLYADKDLLRWFTEEYGQYTNARLDMGKSCVRFKKAGQIPHKLIGELVAKITPLEWINIYETELKR